MYDPSCRYVYHTYTRPEYRGRRLPAALNALDETEAAAQGRTHTISFVESHNYPSIAFGNRLGNRCIGYAGYVRLCGRPYPFRTPGARRHGFQFGAEPET
jgi:hypothetical protein